MALRRPLPVPQTEPPLTVVSIRVHEWRWLAVLGGLLLLVTLLPLLVAARQTPPAAVFPGYQVIP